MIKMEFTPEVGRALYELIRTAQNKGRKSEWWAKISAPLVGPQSTGPSFHELLRRQVQP